MGPFGEDADVICPGPVEGAAPDDGLGDMVDDEPDVGVQVREEFRNLVSAGNGLGAASGCGLDEVVLGVEGCDAESCLGEGLGWGEGLEEGEAQEDLGRQHGGGEPG